MAFCNEWNLTEKLYGSSVLMNYRTKRIRVTPRQVNTQVKPLEISSNGGKYFYNVHIFKSNFGHLYCSLVNFFFWMIREKINEKYFFIILYVFVNSPVGAIQCKFTEAKRATTSGFILLSLNLFWHKKWTQ